MWPRLSRAIRDNPIMALVSVLASVLALFGQVHQLRKECPDRPLLICMCNVVFGACSTPTISHPGPVPTGRARDNHLDQRAWQQAQDQDIPEAYSAYLEQFPDGIHLDEARTRRAELTSPQDCDYLAASPVDPAKNEKVSGIQWRVMDGERAIEACASAVARFPKVLHFTYQLARAYQKSSRSEIALPILEALSKQGYVAAYDNIGWIYVEGKAVPADIKLAVSYFRQGADAKQPEAMTSLGIVYEYHRNYAVAKYWYQKAMVLGYLDAKERYQKLQETPTSDSNPDIAFPLPFPLPLQ